MEEVLKLKKATYHLWTFTISKLISSFGAQVYTFAISFYILQLTGSAASFAMNLICSLLPRMFVAPFAGYAADKYSRKAIVIIAQFTSTLAIAGLLTVSLTSGISLVAIYTTTVVLSIASAFSGISFSSSITGLVDEKRIQKAMSLNQMSISISAIGSPALAGVLYGTVEMPVFLVMYLVASIIAVILESTMNFKLFAKRKEVVEGEPKESMWQSMKAGFAYLKLQPLLMTIIWISLCVNFLFGSFQVGFSFTLIEKLKVPSEHFGLMEGAFAVGMLLLSIHLSMRKDVKYPLLVAKRGLIVVGLLLSGIGLPLVLSMVYNVMFTYYAFVMFSFGATLMIVNTPMLVMMQKMIDDDYKGRVFSILETIGMALTPLGVVIFGFLYDIFPAQWIFIISGLFLIGVALVMARPSVMKKAYPELGAAEAAKAETVTE